MPYLNWISDKDLVKHTSGLLNAAETAKKTKSQQFFKNVIDPFQAIFEMSGYAIGHEEWREGELARQVGKAVQNKIGEFHQNILGSVEGWQNLGTGEIVDLLSQEQKIIAEIKNKHNTVTGSKRVDVYDQLKGLVLPNNSRYNDFTAYFVNIIPKNTQPYDDCFTPPDNTTGNKRSAHELIRAIDGASFYAIVTQVPDALQQLYTVLPKVIHDIRSYKVLNNDDIDVLEDYFERAYGENKS